MTKRGMELGTAGEHIVCADLLVAGYRASMAAAGLPYDVIADVGGRLIKIAVKATQKAKPRPAREGSKLRYHFNMTRGTRLSTGKTERYLYAENDCDIFALVTLDNKNVAYLKRAEAPQSLWLEADTEQVEWRSGKKPSTIRGFAGLTFEAAIS